MIIALVFGIENHNYCETEWNLLSPLQLRLARLQIFIWKKSLSSKMDVTLASTPNVGTTWWADINRALKEVSLKEDIKSVCKSISY